MQSKHLALAILTASCWSLSGASALAIIAGGAGNVNEAPAGPGAPAPAAPAPPQAPSAPRAGAEEMRMRPPARISAPVVRPQGDAPATSPARPEGTATRPATPHHR